MPDSACPICSGPLEATGSGRYYCNSELCRGIYFDPRLVRAPTTADNWPSLLAAARELNSIHDGGATISFDGSTCYVHCADPDGSGREHVLRTHPSTLRDRAGKLLAALGRRTTFFGEKLQIEANDYPLAYVDSSEKLLPYIRYLQETGYLNIEAEALSGEMDVSLTAAGLEACEGGTHGQQKTVFISSTCHDLLDCRDELRRHLEELGYLVRMSDQPASFEMAPDAGALASCLHNVASADAVVGILDSRFGAQILSGDHAGRSVTQAELEHALALRIPVFVFIRRPAFLDWENLRRDAQATPIWVEPHDAVRRKGWVEFVTRLSSHQQDGLRTRWIDQFNSVVDLKRLVPVRLRSAWPTR